MTALAFRRRSPAAVFVCALVALTPVILGAQYPLVPTPVLNAAALTTEPRVFGYLSLRETVRDDSAAFTIFRARLGVQARPVSFLAFKLQVDFAALGRASNDTVPGFSIVDIYAQGWLPDTSSQVVRTLRPTLLVGQFKTPFSLEDNTSTSHVLTANRSLVVDRHSSKRDMGALGHVRLSRFGTLAGAVVNGEGANRISNPDGKQMAIGRLTLLPLPQLAIAGKMLNQGDDHRWGYDARLFVADQLIVEGETIKHTGPSGGTELDAGGGYVAVAYRPVYWAQPLIKWERLRELRTTSTTAVETEVRFTTFGFNFLAPRDRYRIRLQLNWVAKSGDPFNGDDEFIVQLHTIF